MKTHRRLWLILTVLGAVAVLVAGTAVGVKALTGERLLGCLLRRDDRTLENVLAAADEELSRGYASRAETTLDQGYAGARGEGETLRLLKRELALAEATGSYRRLARQARKAWDRLPGSPRLAEVAAWAALRAEDPQGAGTLLSRSSRFGELDGLRAEAFLRGWVAELRLSGSAPDRLRTLAELPTVRDPAALRTLADVIGEPRLDLDAALEWMREGRAGEAFAALWPRRENPAITEALLFIALDAGHYTEAWDLLARQAQSSELPDRLVLGGDIACLLGMRDQAAVRYQEAIQLDPGYSWVPYLNLAAILETSGDREGARDFRRRAYARFPERGEVVLAHARDLAAAGERGRARELVEGLLARDPSQVSAHLLALELEGARGSPAVFRGRLWELVNRHPDDPDLARTFAFYLLGLRDVEGASAVLSQYAQARGGPEPPWFLELEGIVALTRGDSEQAAERLRRSVEAETSWRRRFNLAMALMASDRYEEAVGELIRSEAELSGGQGSGGQESGGRERAERETSRGFRSAIRSRIAEAQMHLGDRDGARREALYALDLDPSNHHARRILRILDGLR